MGDRTECMHTLPFGAGGGSIPRMPVRKKRHTYWGGFEFPRQYEKFEISTAFPSLYHPVTTRTR